MTEELLNHYRQFSAFSDPGPFKDKLLTNLPEPLPEIGEILMHSLIHGRAISKMDPLPNEPKTWAWGDLSALPWHRQPEDDMFTTVAGMLAELYRRDARGLVRDRQPNDRLVLSCRNAALLMLSVLKSRGLPARCRIGSAVYYGQCEKDKPAKKNLAFNHWINQYWNESKNRWVTIDVYGKLWQMRSDLDHYDIPQSEFSFPADSWLGIRSGQIDPRLFDELGRPDDKPGTTLVLNQLFRDFHALMNYEVVYANIAVRGYKKTFDDLTPKQLNEVDDLARLMQQPDENFEKLLELWDTNGDFRLLTGGTLRYYEKKG